MAPTNLNYTGGILAGRASTKPTAKLTPDQFLIMGITEAQLKVLVRNPVIRDQGGRFAMMEAGDKQGVKALLETWRSELQEILDILQREVIATSGYPLCEKRLSEELAEVQRAHVPAVKALEDILGNPLMN